jgi:hypothetical protein
MALTKAHNRMIEGISVNVKDYGAVGDGVTDDTNGAGVDTIQTRKNGSSLDTEQMIPTSTEQSDMFSRIIELEKGDVIDVLLTTDVTVSGNIRNRYININSEV